MATFPRFPARRVSVRFSSSHAHKKTESLFLTNQQSIDGKTSEKKMTMELPAQVKPYVDRIDAFMAKYPSATQYGRYSLDCFTLSYQVLRLRQNLFRHSTQYRGYAHGILIPDENKEVQESMTSLSTNNKTNTRG